MLLLPPSHRVVLQHLLELLTFVAAHQENKMDTYNLALIFAPTLFLSSKTVSQRTTAGVSLVPSVLPSEMPALAVNKTHL